MKDADIILEHYNRIGNSFGLDPKFTMEDSYVREAEKKFVFSVLEKKNMSKMHISDWGCGNGQLLSELANRWSCQLSGIEFTPILHELAGQRNHDIDLRLGDMTVEENCPKECDVIITKRSLINVLDRKEQRQVLQNIRNSLKDRGYYIMLESFYEPLVNLNRAREEMGLKTLEQPEHNLYLNDPLLNYMEGKCGFKMLKTSLPSHYLSTHFYTTRVLHEALRPEGGKIKHGEFVKFFDLALPPSIGNYSPLKFYCFQK